MIEKQESLLKRETSKCVCRRGSPLAWCDKIDDMLSILKALNSNDALQSKHHAVNRIVPQNKKVSPKGRLSNASAGGGSALAWCDKIDDMLSILKALNSNDALQSKHHAVNRIVPQNKKVSPKGRLSNASAGGGSPLAWCDKTDDIPT